VAAPADGPLRAALEEIGAEVHITAPWGEHSAAAYEGRQAELSCWTEAQGVNIVLANTMSAFGAVDMASRLGLPALWAIHESYPLAAYWLAAHGDHPPDAHVRRCAQRALRQATAVIFEARSTRDLYAAVVPADRRLVVPYGIDIAAIDEFVAGADRKGERARLGISPTATVVLCMGTIEPRKSQTLLLCAFRAVADRHPDAELIMVGDLGDTYAATLREAAGNSGLGPRVRIESVVEDPLPWYHTADLLISGSDIESLPRSALEAMAVGTPVLAAAAHGVPELIEDSVTGWLCRPRDLDDLSAALDRVLGIPRVQRDRVAAAARARVRSDYDSSGYVATYAALIDALVADPAVEPAAVLARG
jgi:glycosyltransferase involved in cell wall biosynthesis